jgi:SET domain-containing protein
VSGLGEEIPPAYSTFLKKLNIMEKTLEIKEYGINGRGVFALKDFEEDEVIEYFPVLNLADRARYHSDEVIQNYGFKPACNCEECKIHGNIISIFLGYVTLTNHSDDPSARIYQPNREEGAVHANRFIRKGEEITIYHVSKDSDKVSEETFQNVQTQTIPEPDIE